MDEARPFEDAFLRDYSDEHVKYEIGMFFAMVESMEQRRRRSNTRASWPPVSAPLPRPTTLGVNTIAVLSGHVSAPTATDNAVVESFMAHYRNLVEFLFKPSPKLSRLQSTDVVAIDFDDTWQLRRPDLSDRLHTAFVRVNKELAHLTTGRLSGASAAKNWDARGLADDIRPLLLDFVRGASVERLAPSVREAIR